MSATPLNENATTTQTAPAKMALCIKKAELGLPEFFSGVFTEQDYHNLMAGRGQAVRHPLMVEYHLLDRADCESDESYLQLLPYAALRTRRNGTTYIATYQRGRAGAEPGLHDKFSIGFGGHVDTKPNTGETITHHLAAELQRELSEEIGVDMAQERLHRLISNCSYIYLVDNKVDRVHLGLPVVIDVSDSLELVSKEPDQICHLKWTSVEEVRALSTAGRLENWSALMVEEELV